MQKEENNTSDEKINNVSNELSDPSKDNNLKDENTYNQIPFSSGIQSDNSLVQNIENENNNNIINNQSELNIQLNEPEIYNPKITFCFILFLFINIIGYIHSFFKSYDIKNYSLILWPLLRKKQYYRILSNHFYHHGLFDLLTNMFGTYHITQYL